MGNLRVSEFVVTLEQNKQVHDPATSILSPKILRIQPVLNPSDTDTTQFILDSLKSELLLCLPVVDSVLTVHHELVYLLVLVLSYLSHCKHQGSETFCCVAAGVHCYWN